MATQMELEVIFNEDENGKRKLCLHPRFLKY